MEINKHIESTNLSMTMTDLDVDLLVKEAIELNCMGVCVPPYWVSRARREIGNHDLKLVTVIGYPLGYQMTETKIKETELALNQGASEIDVVINASAFKTNPNWVKNELVGLSDIIHQAGGLLKVILETDLWSKSELFTLLTLCADSGVDIAKSSTGYHRNPVTPEIIAFFRKHLPIHMGIKASGGIKTKEHALELLASGADRLGTSSAFQILSNESS
jgi:deoxyribose-phosphate aldolase